MACKGKAQGGWIVSVYGYLRVSTETQAEHGNGLDVQREKIADAYKVDEWFVDAGVSGTLESRPALDKMIAGLQKDDCVVVLNTSRLWRDMFAQACITKAIMKAGAKVASIEQPTYDLYAVATDPTAFLIQSIMGTLDQWDRMTISRKLAAGRRAKASKGTKPCGRMPYGYRYNAKKEVEVDPVQSEVVLKIFRWYAAGKSLADIADELNSSGVYNGQGKEWQRGTLAKMLHNRFYLGEMVHGDIVVKDAHRGIVSAVLFGKVDKRGK